MASAEPSPDSPLRDPSRLPAAPRVALVHDWLTGTRGGEKVLSAIAAHFPDAPIYTLFHFPGTIPADLEAHPIVTSFLQRAPGLRRHYRRYLPLFPAAIEDFDLSGFDLVISVSHAVAKGIVPHPGTVHVCYCNSPMRYAWDQEHVYFPGRRGPMARVRGLALSALRAWDVASTPRVDHFLANSSFIAQRIRRYYDRGSEVLHPPVDLDLFTLPTEGEAPAEDTSLDDGSPYALVVTALVPYKRVDLAIRACRRLGLELRIVGDGPERGALERLARQGGSGSGSGASPVRFLGRATDEELRSLYRGAAAVLQPGVEDFGIVPVEALACGTPVVALGRGGVLDIVEDGRHGVLVPPEAAGDAEALAAAIDKVVTIRFNPLYLRQQAERFSIGAFQRRFRDLLRTFLGEDSPLRRPTVSHQPPTGLSGEPRP